MIPELVERVGDDENTRALVREVLSFHREGLEKIAAALDEDTKKKLLDDPLVRALFDLHDLLPDPSLLPAKQLLAKKKKLQEVCELCGVPTGERHEHVVDPKTGNVQCTCTACALLMDTPVSKLRRVPDRVVRVSPGEGADEAWRALGIPVAIAFFVKSSVTGDVRALYPGAVGATTATTTREAFAALEAAHPELSAMAPDVEAFVVSRMEGAREHWICGVHRAYELAGRVRTKWSGFSGGESVRTELATFFGALAKEVSS